MTTILGMRSFDRGNSMLNTVDVSLASNVIASTSQSRTGAYSLRLGSATQWARWYLLGTPNAPSMSAWVYLATSFNTSGTGTAGSNIRFSLTAGGDFVELRWNGTTHTYDAYVGGALFAAGTIEIAVNTWFHVQFFATIADAGNITVLLNGHESINTNGDTKPGAVDTVDYLYIYGGRLGTGAYDYIDDLVYGFDGLLGSLRVRERVPDSDVSAVWTSSTGGANYTTVDETPQSDTDYNESDTDGQLDKLDLATIDFATLEEEPVALMAWARAQMAEGTGDSIEVGLDSNVTAVSTASILSAAWQYYFHTADEDPDGGGQPWAAASANAATLTYESVIT